MYLIYVLKIISEVHKLLDAFVLGFAEGEFAVVDGAGGTEVVTAQAHGADWPPGG